LGNFVNIVLAGGGTAGHIEPALNLADQLKIIDPQVNITVLGTARGLEVDLVPARGYELELIPAVPLPRKLSGELVTLPIRLRSAISETAAFSSFSREMTAQGRWSLPSIETMFP
jgi:UDP-N-acetylglucosamine--N-acetylmuramyl-(pentapeptide) pyrophosphoryl-undecaprenol N-acetylglucosamine transferase